MKSLMIMILRDFNLIPSTCWYEFGHLMLVITPFTNLQRVLYIYYILRPFLSMALLGVIFDIWLGIQEFGLRDDDLKPSGHELHCSL